MNLVQRFLYQPSFEGHVDPDAVYVIADDNLTLGATVAMLRTHIVANGGTVGAVCALCSGNGEDLTFSIAKSTLNVLLSRYGPSINELWTGEIGHEVSALTDREGSALGEFARFDGGTSPLQHLRESILKARAGIE